MELGQLALAIAPKPLTTPLLAASVQAVDLNLGTGEAQAVGASVVDLEVAVAAVQEGVMTLALIRVNERSAFDGLVEERVGGDVLEHADLDLAVTLQETEDLGLVGCSPAAFAPRAAGTEVALIGLNLPSQQVQRLLTAILQQQRPLLVGKSTLPGA